MRTYTKSQFEVRRARGDAFSTPEGETTCYQWNVEANDFVLAPCRVVEDSPYLQTWLQIGLRNEWISCADDPPFDETCFAVATSVEELQELIKGNNWAVGQAFYLDDVCFINQVDAGSEFLVIKQDVDFESFSVHLMIIDGCFADHVRAILAATREQCRRRQYGEAHPDARKRLEAVARNTVAGGHPRLLESFYSSVGRVDTENGVDVEVILPYIKGMQEAELRALL